MGRPRTGSAIWDPAKGSWVAWLTLDGGKRHPVALPELPAHEDACTCTPKAPCALRARAQAKARVLSEAAKATGAVDASAGETCDEYFERWATSREARVRTVSDDRGRWKRWVMRELGTMPIAAITSHDLRAFVETLDANVRAKKLSWKTALHVWGLVTKMFDDAHKGKTAALLVRADNPAKDVRGPDRGADKASTFLFPRELLALVSHPDVPTVRQRLYAFAAYTGLRAGEIRALEWGDVHEQEGYLGVHRSVDRKGKEKHTKTGLARRVTIEPTILPMLEAMRREGGGTGRLFERLHHAPDVLRADLLTAGVTRDEIHIETPTRRRLDFHDLRHTYGTWRAIRGDDVIKIRFAMGHTDLATTQRYINEAYAVGENFGELFGALPEFRNGSVISLANYAKLSGGAGNRKRPETDNQAENSGSQENEEAKPATIDEPQTQLDAALARALDEATRAGRWELVAQLAGELAARRAVRGAS